MDIYFGNEQNRLGKEQDSLLFTKFFKSKRLGLKPNKASVSMGFRAKQTEYDSYKYKALQPLSPHKHSLVAD